MKTDGGPSKGRAGGRLPSPQTSSTAAPTTSHNSTPTTVGDRSTLSSRVQSREQKRARTGTADSGALSTGRRGLITPVQHRARAFSGGGPSSSTTPTLGGSPSSDEVKKPGSSQVIGGNPAAANNSTNNPYGARNNNVRKVTANTVTRGALAERRGFNNRSNSNGGPHLKPAEITRPHGSFNQDAQGHVGKFRGGIAAHNSGAGKENHEEGGERRESTKSLKKLSDFKDAISDAPELPEELKTGLLKLLSQHDPIGALGGLGALGGGDNGEK